MTDREEHKEMSYLETLMEGVLLRMLSTVLGVSGRLFAIGEGGSAL